MQGARCKVQGARCKVQGARCKVQGARCKVQGARCKMQDTRLSKNCQGYDPVLSIVTAHVINRKGFLILSLRATAKSLTSCV